MGGSRFCALGPVPTDIHPCQSRTREAWYDSLIRVRNIFHSQALTCPEP